MRMVYLFQLRTRYRGAWLLLVSLHCLSHSIVTNLARKSNPHAFVGVAHSPPEQRLHSFTFTAPKLIYAITARFVSSGHCSTI